MFVLLASLTFYKVLPVMLSFEYLTEVDQGLQEADQGLTTVSHRLKKQRWCLNQAAPGSFCPIRPRGGLSSIGLGEYYPCLLVRLSKSS